MNKNRSVATLDNPEFINLEPYNPLISKCEIKVFYLGENRNHSYIDKNTAIQMANSLPGTPIVGAFIEDKDDFGDHGHVIKIEDGEIHFSTKTVPYGFVAPDAQVWFQKFIDTDKFGNETEREYLMTTGYLWTGQYEEAMQCIEAGKGQSMELDSSTLDGEWATNSKTGIEFFIINDALFSKLCILGDDVEPCFEGAAVTQREVSRNFSCNTEFSQTLFTMMNELKDALQNKGGSDMPEELNQSEAVEENEPETVEEIEEAAEVEEAETDESTEEEGEPDETGEFTQSEFAEEDEQQEESASEETGASEVSEETNEEEPVEEPEKQNDDEDGSKKKPVNHSLEAYEELQERYEKLASSFSALEEEVESLRSFKLNVENAQKDELINKYHMLSDEDKAEIIEHKEEYTCEEIEAKLAVIYVQKNVDFSTLTGEKEETEKEEPSVAFSLDSEVAGYDLSSSDVIEALRRTKEND